MSGRDPEESVETGEATRWFEQLYAEAEQGRAVVPWDRQEPHPLLVDWVEEHRLDGEGRRAVVVGSGLGENAEYLAALGHGVFAFDISESAIRSARARFPTSNVTYLAADLFDLPPEWRGAFDLVVEIFTVQSLPPSLHARAIREVAGLVAPGGQVMVIAFAPEGFDDPLQGPPWPLAREEIESFASADLRFVAIEHLPMGPDTDLFAWRAVFRNDAQPIET